MAKIAFTNEASESFANLLQHIQGYVVEVTPEEGEPFDAVVIESAADNEELDDFFAVRLVKFNHATGDREGDPFDLVVRQLKVF